MNINGGTITGSASSIWYQICTDNPNIDMTISGGEIISTSDQYAPIYVWAYNSGFDATNVKMAIKGGYVNTNGVSDVIDWDDAESAFVNLNKKVISGGKFSVNPDAYVAEGYISTANTDPETKVAYPYAVKQGSFICAIGTTKYETLQDAINACEAGTETTIKLLDNVTDGAGFAIPDGVTNKNIIIDFDGKSYNVTKDAVGSGNTKTQAMHFYSGNTLTLKNGTITSADTSEENKLKMMMQNYCNLTLDGMTIDCSNVNGGTYPNYSGTAYEYWSNKSVPVFNFNTGNATIKNTTITFRDGDNVGLCVDGGTVALGEGTVVNGPVSAVTGTVTITDGKYSGAVTADQATLKISGGIFAEKPADEYCAEGYVVTDNEDEETKVQYPYTVMSKEDAGIYDLFDSTIPDKYKAYEDYGVTENKNVKSVTYTRKFTSSDVTFYRPWYIPFDYKITETDTENFVFFRISMIAGSERSGEVDNNNEIILFIKSMEVNEVLKANRPYILRPKVATGEYVFKAENTMLYAPESTSRKHLETSEFKYDFYGNYVKDYPCGPAYSMYYLGSRGAFSPNGSTSKLQSYRWYVKVESNDINADAKPVFEFVEEDGEATGINNTNAESADEIEGIYNSNGIRLESKTKGLNIIKYKSGKTKKIYIK